MAPLSLVVAALMSLLLISQSSAQSFSPTAADQRVLQLVNDYRTGVVGISAFVSNNAAACVGYQVAHKYVGTPCNNATGADTPYGQSPEFPDFPTMLATCGVALINASGGYIAPNCVPDASASDAPLIAAQNITDSQLYQDYLNDTTYASAGVGSEGAWYVLVLATDSSDGNFGVTPNLKVSSENGSHRLQIPVIMNISLIILGSLFASYRNIVGSSGS